MRNLDRLVEELCNLPSETSWVEFKHNNYAPDMIGRDISALANSAALAGKARAYMIWGIHNDTHEIIGTKESLQSLKVGAQELENWLRSMLSDNAAFEFHDFDKDNNRIGVLIIERAINRTVTFQKVDYIRIGSYTKKLSDIPAIQGPLWDKIRNLKFEEQYAEIDVNKEDVAKLLDYSIYFDLLEKLPQPNSFDGVVHYLVEENIIAKQDNGLYAITNLGAIVLAKDLRHFKTLKRKAVRVVQYENTNRMNMLRDEIFFGGYAVVFEKLIKFIEALVPMREEFISGVRKKNVAYPISALRETVANALIHQDFFVSGAGPLVEIFSNRIEITNPGDSLVNIKRIIDNPPKSQNEKLASLLRELGLCEELGSGWDRIVLSCEYKQLPAPKIETFSDDTRVTLFSEVSFTGLSMDDKLWACYLHACVKYVQSEQVTNRSLRERFGLSEKNAGSISRLIKEAVNQKYIKPVDPNTAPRYMRYIPIWA